MLRLPLLTAMRHACLIAISLPLSTLLYGTARAQSFNASTLSPTLRQVWCESQINVCSLICQSAGSSVTSDTNQCNDNDLSYTCTCLNGFSPDVALYTNTIPNFICEQVFTQCITGSVDNAADQATCKSEADAFCVGFSAATTVSSFDLQTSTLSNGSVVTSGSSLTLIEVGVAATSGSSGSSSSSPTSTTGSLSSSSSTTQASSTTSGAATSKKTGISSGALAAAIAVPVVVIALLALGFGFFVYRKRKTAKLAADANQPEGWGKAELHGEAIPPTELPMQERFELQGEGLPGEVVGDGPPVHEMGGPTSPN